jgi:nucleoside-diphosphate-sugar epimerase
VRLAPQGQRDWVHSAQVAQALAGMLQADALAHRIYNLSPGRVWHPSVFCQALQLLDPGFDWALADGAQPPNIDLFDDLSRQRSALRCSRAQAEGWDLQADVALQAGAYARWALAHKAWFG